MKFELQSLTPNDLIDIAKERYENDDLEGMITFSRKTLALLRKDGKGGNDEAITAIFAHIFLSHAYLELSLFDVSYQHAVYALDECVRYGVTQEYFLIEPLIENYCYTKMFGGGDRMRYYELLNYYNPDPESCAESSQVALTDWQIQTNEWIEINILSNIRIPQGFYEREEEVESDEDLDVNDSSDLIEDIEFDSEDDVWECHPVASDRDGFADETDKPAENEDIKQLLDKLNSLLSSSTESSGFEASFPKGDEYIKNKFIREARDGGNLDFFIRSKRDYYYAACMTECLRNEKVKDALNFEDKVLTMDVSCDEGMISNLILTNVYSELDRKDRVISQIDRLKSRCADNPDFLYNLMANAVYAESFRQVAEIGDIFEENYSFYNSHIMTWHAVANIRIGKVEEGRKELRKIRTLYGGHGLGQFYLEQLHSPKPNLTFDFEKLESDIYEYHKRKLVNLLVLTPEQLDEAVENDSLCNDIYYLSHWAFRENKVELDMMLFEILSRITSGDLVADIIRHNLLSVDLSASVVMDLISLAYMFSDGDLLRKKYLAIVKGKLAAIDFYDMGKFIDADFSQTLMQSIKVLISLAVMNNDNETFNLKELSFVLNKVLDFEGDGERRAKVMRMRSVKTIVNVIHQEILSSCDNVNQQTVAAFKKDRTPLFREYRKTLITPKVKMELDVHRAENRLKQKMNLFEPSHELVNPVTLRLSPDDYLADYRRKD